MALPVLTEKTRGPSKQHVATVTAFVTVDFSPDDGQIDPEVIKAHRGAVALRFKPGKHRRVAVKIVDDRGIESLRVVEVA